MSKPAPINEPATRRRFNLLGVLALTVCLPLIAMSQFIAHARTDDIDAWFFLHYGRELLSGATLYADVWDIKPPGIFWLNALGLGLSGGSPIGVWVLCGLAAIGSAILFYLIARKAYDRPTAVIGVIFAAMYFNFWTFHVGSNRPATFLILTELGCMFLYIRSVSLSSPPGRLLFWAGVVGGLGLWFKQTAFVAPVAIILHLLFTKSNDTASRWRKVSRFGTGYASSIIVLIIILALTSDLRWAWDAIVRFNQQFFAPGIATSLVPSIDWMVTHCRGMALPLILAVATLAHPIFKCCQRPTSGNGESDTQDKPSILPLLWTWMLVAIYLSAVGPHNRPMYLAVALPPLIMLATHSVFLLINSASDGQHGTPPHYIVVGVIWFAYMLWTPMSMQIDFALRQYHWINQPADANLIATIDAIQQYAKSDEAIFVDGYAPELYWRADRHQAVRYLGTEKIHQLKQNGQGLMDETTRCLMAAKPRVIMFDFDRFQLPDQPGYANADKLQKWVRENYIQPELDRFPTLWVRSPAPQ